MAGLELVVDAELVRTADEWADEIKADLDQAQDFQRRSAEKVISAGKKLQAARNDLKRQPNGHGQWLPMLKRIGIDDRVARQLMSIADNSAISNRSNYSDLPAAARALYELSRLPDEQIEEGITTGDINSDMTIKDARDLSRPSWYCEGGGHDVLGSVRGQLVGSRFCCPRCAEDWRVPDPPVLDKRPTPSLPVPGRDYDPEPSHMERIYDTWKRIDILLSSFMHFKNLNDHERSKLSSSLDDLLRKTTAVKDFINEQG